MKILSVRHVSLIGISAFAALTVFSACSTTPTQVASEYSGRGSRAPASFVPVMRKIFTDGSEESGTWLVKFFSGEGADDAAKTAARVRSGITTLRPQEVRTDERLLQILSKDAAEFSEQDAKYLLEFVNTKALGFANCEQCLSRRQNFLSYRKLIRKRLQEVSGTSQRSRRDIVSFVKNVEVLMDKDLVDPKRLKDLVDGVQTEKFVGEESAHILDTIQMMLLSAGKDLDVKAAADLINSWPRSSLQGLKKFYSEALMVQASENVDIETAAEIVLKRLNVSDPEEVRHLKVCALFKK